MLRRQCPELCERLAVRSPSLSPRTLLLPEAASASALDVVVVEIGVHPAARDAATLRHRRTSPDARTSLLPG